MEKDDIFEEIIDMGRARGRLTYDEINNAVSSEYFSTDELEELISTLHDMGIEVSDNQETEAPEEDLTSGDESQYEETADIVQSYFHSLGNISILTRSEEIEFAKNLEEGKEIINTIITELPLYKKVEALMHEKAEDSLNNSEEDTTDEAFEVSLKALDELMIKIENAERKIAGYGTLSKLKKIISEKKKKGNSVFTTQGDCKRSPG